MISICTSWAGRYEDFYIQLLGWHLHLVVENLGLAGLGLGDKRVVEDLEDILADFLQLALDLLPVLTDESHVLLRALGLLLLLDGRDDAP